MLDTFVFGPFNVLFGIVGLALLLLKIWALVDAAIRRESAYVAAGKQTKTLWLALTGASVAVDLIGLAFLSLFGLVASIVYLVDVRPAVREVRRGGPYGGGRW